MHMTQWMKGAAAAGLVFCWTLGSANAQLSGLVPVNPQPRTDKLGNDWYVEQNGMISRQGGGNSILSGAMMLMVGSEQFYCNQPMGTSDGKEMVLMGQQPMQGLQVTRYVRMLEKEGGMRFMEMFTNTSGRDIATNVEIRHNFSGQVKSILTDAARANNGAFEKGESGIAIVPGSTNYRGYLFTACAPRSSVKPRIASQTSTRCRFSTASRYRLGSRPRSCTRSPRPSSPCARTPRSWRSSSAPLPWCVFYAICPRAAVRRWST